MGGEDFKAAVFLRGERVYLRPLEPDDVKRCQRWINDPDTRVSLGGPHFPMSEAAEREFIENTGKQQDSVHFAIVLTDSDRHIGACGLASIRWRDRTAEFGLLIGEADQRGKGYGSEVTELILKYAFETLNLNRVGLYVLPFNEAGIRAYEKAGFVKEGVQREYAFREGRYWDHVAYSMLAREYFSRAGRPAGNGV